MRTFKKLLLALAVPAIVVCALAIFVPREQEPIYKGKTLSTWLAICQAHSDFDLTHPDPRYLEAQNAVLEIGTNAIPCFIKWMRYEYKPWQIMLWRRLPLHRPIGYRFLRTVEGIPARRSDDVQRGFMILGTNAGSAAPEIAAMMDDSSKPNTKLRAEIVMTELGVRSFNCLTSRFADLPRTDRARLLALIGSDRMAGDVGTNTCLQIASGALSDPDPPVRLIATNLVQRLSTNARPR